MDDARFVALCSHYKDTCDIHKNSVKRRNTIFYLLLIVLAIFTLQLSSSQLATSIVSAYILKIAGIRISNNVEFISTLLWLLLLGLLSRYYQVVFEIERQYSYLEVLENELSKQYQNSDVYTRESEFYLKDYPVYLDWVSFLYDFFFPLLVLLCITLRINNELAGLSMIKVNNFINIVCFFVSAIATLLYFYRLHRKVIKTLVEKIKNIF